MSDTPPVRMPRIGDGARSVANLGADRWRDLYHSLLVMPLWGFFSVMAAAFLALNGLFGLLYWVDPGGLTGAQPGSYADAFFFSVQTFGTMGYGVMAPKSLWANWSVTAEVFVAIFFLAIATGLMFARISRPTARIMFSKIAVITPYEGVPTLMIRAANRRRNMVVEAEASLNVLLTVTTAEGVTMRRFESLALIKPSTPLFALTWQMMHAIGETSPLYGETRESLIAKSAEILVILKGLDETFVTTIHSRKSYLPEDIVWGARFADIFSMTPDGRRLIDYGRFDSVVQEADLGA